MKIKKEGVCDMTFLFSSIIIIILFYSIILYTTTGGGGGGRGMIQIYIQFLFFFINIFKLQIFIKKNK